MIGPGHYIKTGPHRSESPAASRGMSEDEGFFIAQPNPEFNGNMGSVPNFCSYLAVRSMGMKTTEVAGLLNLTQPAVSRSLLRGEEILKESKEFDELLNKL